ncbi:Lipase member H [Pseudolycoriella hygida]|uniref:Lipase member H n=1 Tax=Pseudolycoriella hygida TaxID=35572 RepID=A0A9Q0S523_9DIPT|nr:Lipase member H [Pseudolycoriella hygida]
MKLFFLMLFGLLVAGVTSIPVCANDNDDEVESKGNVLRTSNDEDWQLVPDSNGRLHMVDIKNVDPIVEPSFVAINDMIFRLWTRSNPNAGQVIQIHNNAELDSSNFNPALQTRFHCHGWGTGGPNMGSNIRVALLSQGDFNIFIADWGAGSNTLNYITARNRVNQVGAVVAQFVDWINLRGVPFSAITIIGSSLGAHVAGAAGKRTTRGRVHAVVGLDPAGPLFSLDQPTERMHHTDADYVESIITDAGRLGFEHPIGHANFYPNWGTQQPGCGDDFVGNCGHSIASHFLSASINPVHIFGAIRCRDLNDIRQRNCVVSGTSRRMGGEPIMDGPGIVGSVYLLHTHAEYPFAQGPR